MPTLCVQCAMRAILEDRKPPVFEETPEEHARRVHPDQEETQHEREELERRLVQHFLKPPP